MAIIGKSKELYTYLYVFFSFKVQVLVQNKHCHEDLQSDIVRSTVCECTIVKVM